jgi:phage shock protein C
MKCPFSRFGGGRFGGGSSGEDRLNPHRLYRDPSRGYLAGVCAGVAAYVGVQPVLVRFILVLGLIFFFPMAVIAYLLLAFLLPRRPPALYRSPEEEKFWREVSNAPDRTLASLRGRFRELEQRLRKVEADVTSDDFELRRQFRELRP